MLAVFTGYMLYNFTKETIHCSNGHKMKAVVVKKDIAAKTLFDTVVGSRKEPGTFYLCKIIVSITFDN